MRILVVTETLKGRIKDVTFEAGAFAKRISENTGGEVLQVVLGEAAKKTAEELAGRTGLMSLACDHESVSSYNSDAYKAILSTIIEEREIDMVVCPHSATGWDFAPGLAVALNATCVTAVTDVEFDDGMCFVRQILNGKLEAKVKPADGRRVVVTLMPGAFQFIEEASPSPGKVEEILVGAVDSRIECLGYRTAEKTVDLTAADAIVAAGRGVGEEGVEMIRKLSSHFDNSSIAGSRAICDAGWLPMEYLVGITGQTVSPRLYLACGISGAIQHTSAITGARMIIAINKDPHAMIFNHAHLGVVQDLNRFLPILIEKIEERSHIRDMK